MKREIIAAVLLSASLIFWLALMPLLIVETIR